MLKEEQVPVTGKWGDKSQRYQNQPWYIKLWRRRYQILIPYYAFRLWVLTSEPFSLCWSIEVGISHVRMNWVYDAETLDSWRKSEK